MKPSPESTPTPYELQNWKRDLLIVRGQKREKDARDDADQKLEAKTHETLLPDERISEQKQHKIHRRKKTREIGGAGDAGDSGAVGVSGAGSIDSSHSELNLVSTRHPSLHVETSAPSDIGMSKRSHSRRRSIRRDSVTMPPGLIELDLERGPFANPHSGNGVAKTEKRRHDRKTNDEMRGQVRDVFGDTRPQNLSSSEQGPERTRKSKQRRNSATKLELQSMLLENGDFIELKEVTHASTSHHPSQSHDKLNPKPPPHDKLNPKPPPGDPISTPRRHRRHESKSKSQTTAITPLGKLVISERKLRESEPTESATDQTPSIDGPTRRHRSTSCSRKHPTEVAFDTNSPHIFSHLQPPPSPTCFLGHCVSVTVIRTDPLSLLPDVAVRTPVARVSFIDFETGTYLKKSDVTRPVSAPHEGTVDHIVPIVTQPFDLAAHSTATPAWNETLVFNEDYLHLLSTRNATCVFEILDWADHDPMPEGYARRVPSDVPGRDWNQHVEMMVMRGGKGAGLPKVGGSEDMELSGWRRIAWAFLKLVGSGGGPTDSKTAGVVQRANTESVARLQLYRYRAGTARLSLTHPPVSSVLPSLHPSPFLPFLPRPSRTKYPGSLYVSIKAHTPLQPSTVWGRPRLPTDREMGRLPYGDLAVEWRRRRREGDEVWRSLAGLGETPNWRRKHGQQCKVPNKLLCTIDAGPNLATSQSSTPGSFHPIKLYFVPSSHRLVTLAGHHGPIYQLTWSSDDSELASASADGTARVWAFRGDGEVRHEATFQHPGYVYACTWHPVAEWPKILFTGGWDGKVRGWRCGNRALDVSTPAMTFEGHESYVNSVIFTSDGTKMFSGDGKGVVRVWSCTVGRGGDAKVGDDTPVKEPDWMAFECIKIIQAAFSPCGAYVIAGSSDGRVLMFHAETGKLAAIYADDQYHDYLEDGDGDGPQHLEDPTPPFPFFSARISRSGRPNPVLTLAFHPLDHFLALGGFGDRQPVVIYTYEKPEGIETKKAIAERFWTSTGLGEALSESPLDIRTTEKPGVGDLELTRPGRPDIMNVPSIMKGLEYRQSSEKTLTKVVSTVDEQITRVIQGPNGSTKEQLMTVTKERKKKRSKSRDALKSKDKLATGQIEASLTQLPIASEDHQGDVPVTEERRRLSLFEGRTKDRMASIDDRSWNADDMIWERSADTVRSIFFSDEMTHEHWPLARLLVAQFRNLGTCEFPTERPFRMDPSPSAGALKHPLFALRDRSRIRRVAFSLANLPYYALQTLIGSQFAENVREVLVEGVEALEDPDHQVGLYLAAEEMSLIETMKLFPRLRCLECEGFTFRSDVFWRQPEVHWESLRALALRHVAIPDESVSEAFFNSVVRLCPRLEKVAMQGFRMETMTQVQQLAHFLRRLSSLQELNLEGDQNLQQATFADILSRLPKLRVLDVQETLFGNLSMISVAEHCVHLEALNVSGTKLTQGDLVGTVVRNLKELRELHVQCAGVSLLGSVKDIVNHRKLKVFSYDEESALDTEGAKFLRKKFGDNHLTYKHKGD
ncbi:Jouberin [Gonapodya sp. JEL0774]|nr:Jouberin [Gonapodya sp. JEL0774]